jgi:hypothetical protein
MYPAAADGYRLCLGRVSGPADFLLVFLLMQQLMPDAVSGEGPEGACRTTLRQTLGAAQAEAA